MWLYKEKLADYKTKSFLARLDPGLPLVTEYALFYCVACHLGLFRYGSPRHQRPLPAKESLDHMMSKTLSVLVRYCSWAFVKTRMPGREAGDG